MLSCPYRRSPRRRRFRFLVEHEGRLLAIEVKGSASTTPKDAAHLRAFIDEYGSRVHGALLLHAGAHVQPPGDRVLAVPWWKML